MKEYEKLAGEYINDRSEEGARCREAFVQGFLKARGKALDIAIDHVPGKMIIESKELENLGEKEV